MRDANDNPAQRQLQTLIAAALRDPATYQDSAHQVGDLPLSPIRVCETHISWIALVGTWAYKVKKAVRFDYLNYETLALRRVACEAELALNRRWAPELYLGISRLVDTGHGLRFDAEGEPLDYAVRMRRFATGDELDALVGANTVRACELATFGTDIAALQEAATIMRTPARRTVLDALRQTAADPALPWPRDSCAHLLCWARSTWTDLEPAFEARRVAGRVRECHGDLHCGNVVRFDGRLVPFDGIDFDPALRFIDVASDVAFLVMDLESRNRADLAMSFLSAWLERSGDYAAAAGLPILLTYRALVRARIETTRAGQTTGDDGDAHRQRSACYLQLALHYTNRAVGSIVLMHGLSGAGKSVVAAGLVTTLPAVRVRSDVIRLQAPTPQSATPADRPGGDGRYSQAALADNYRRLCEVTGALVIAGFNVIVDATFLDETQRLSFRDLARRHGSPVSIVSCIAPVGVLRERVRARAGDPSEATLAVLETQITTATPLSAEELALTLVVATDSPLDPMAAAWRLGAIWAVQRAAMRSRAAEHNA